MHKRLDMRWIEGVGCWAPNIFTVSASTQSLFLSSALQIITYYANTFQITTRGKFCTKLGYLLIHALRILGFRILGLRILNPRTEDP